MVHAAPRQACCPTANRDKDDIPMTNIPTTQPSAYVVFEPINHVMKVIQAAKRRGFHVVVIRTLPLTLAEPYASASADIDTDIVIDNWANHSAIVQLAADACAGFQVVGSYAAAEITLMPEALFRQRFQLAGLAPERVAFLLDKEKVRTALAGADLTTLATISQEAALQMTEWPAGQTYFFKPVNGAGSALVSKCSSLEQLHAAIANWSKKPEVSLDLLRHFIEKNNRFYLEQAAEGELMSVEGFVVDGVYTELGLSSRTVLERDEAIEMGLSFPYKHPLHEQIVAKVRAIHAQLGVNNGPTHTEIICSDDGRIELVELNIRFVGADVMLAINAAMGVDIEDELLRVTLGEAPRIDLSDRGHGVAVLQQVMPPPGLDVLDTIEFPSEHVVFSKITAVLGKKLASTAFQMDQIGAFIVRGDSYGEAMQCARHVRQNILVNGQLLANNANNIVVLR